jgi:ABC-type lipoprotein release transport system permease subunit
MSNVSRRDLLRLGGAAAAVYVSVTAVQVVIAAIAAWVPAWRATGIEPVAALREE